MYDASKQSATNVANLEKNGIIRQAFKGSYFFLLLRSLHTVFLLFLRKFLLLLFFVVKCQNDFS